MVVLFGWLVLLLGDLLLNWASKRARAKQACEGLLVI